MKNFIIITFISLSLIFQSCTKQAVVTGHASAFTVINAINGSNPLIVDYYGTPHVYTYYSTTNEIGNGAFFEYGMASGSTPFTIYQLSDTTHAVYKQTLNLATGGIYSLYLSGADTLHVDNLLIKEDIPTYSVRDSVIGVRFINLSEGSNPVSVDITGNPNGSEVGSLAYKAITPFKTYPFTSTVPTGANYTFEFRDAASGTLLTSYTYSNMIDFKNITIVLEGLPGSQTAFQVNNY